jgi:hypothetical protein
MPVFYAEASGMSNTGKILAYQGDSSESCLQNTSNNSVAIKKIA